MVRFGETQIAKEIFYAAKRPIIIHDVNVDKIVIWKLVKTKSNSKYLMGYLDKTITPLVLAVSNIRGCVKTFKVSPNLGGLFRVSFWRGVGERRGVGLKLTRL